MASQGYPYFFKKAIIKVVEGAEAATSFVKIIFHAGTAVDSVGTMLHSGWWGVASTWRYSQRKRY